MNIELLPLPNPQVPFIDCDPSMTDIRRLVRWYEQGATEYALANVAHATAAKDAEIEALQAQLDEQCRLHAIGMERELALIAERDRLRAEVERLWEIMRPKREKECLTLDDWRTRAYYLEANWSRCSRACAVEQTKREQAEARAKRLAEELREAKEKMLAQVKWVACDCGCEGEKPADAVSIAWLRASTMLRDQEEGHEQ